MSTYRDIQWCRALFAKLHENGVWGIPRSGLLFEKRGGKLVLIDRMPYVEGMPGRPEQLHAYQRQEYFLVREKFGAAGIAVQAEVAV